MKAIRIDHDLHTKFKSECALHGVTMTEAAGEALQALMAWWRMGVPLYLSDFIQRVGAMRLQQLASEFLHEERISRGGRQ